MFFLIALGICFQSHGQELSPISRQELKKLEQQTGEKWNLSKNQTKGNIGSFFLAPGDFKSEKSIYLSRLNPLGFPIFLGNNNSKSANTMRTNRIQTGGFAGLKLNGRGIGMAEWEGSKETVCKILLKR